jgi:hypothetical protein
VCLLFRGRNRGHYADLRIMPGEWGMKMRQRFLNQKLGKRNTRRAETNKAKRGLNKPQVPGRKKGECRLNTLKNRYPDKCPRYLLAFLMSVVAFLASASLVNPITAEYFLPIPSATKKLRSALASAMVCAILCAKPGLLSPSTSRE